MRVRSLAISAVVLAMAGGAQAQRISAPPASFSPGLKILAPATASAAVAGSGVAKSAQPAPVQNPAGQANQANKIPGQQFTPTLAASSQHSAVRAAHDVAVGDFYFRRQDYAGALSRYQGALRHQPDFPAALWGCGRAEYRLGMYTAAAEYLHRYLAAAPRGHNVKAAQKLLRKMER